MRGNVSVAVTSYNSPEYLIDQIRSIHEQSYSGVVEVVVVDDDSNTANKELISQIEGCKVYFNQVNVGVLRSFSTSLEMTTGQVVFLSDQDDFWLPEKILVALSQIRESWLLLHDGHICSENLTRSGLTKQEQIKSAYGSLDGMVTGALTVVKRELLDIALPIPDCAVSYDSWLHDIARVYDKRIVISDVLQLIRRHENNKTDWFVNRNRPVGVVNRLLAQLRAVRSTHYFDRILHVEALAERIKERRFNSAALNKLEKELYFLYLRQKSVESNALVSMFISMKILFCGGYRYFNGYSSFLKDMVFAVKYPFGKN